MNWAQILIVACVTGMGIFAQYNDDTQTAATALGILGGIATGHYFSGGARKTDVPAPDPDTPAK